MWGDASRMQVDASRMLVGCQQAGRMHILFASYALKAYLVCSTRLFATFLALRSQQLRVGPLTALPQSVYQFDKLWIQVLA